MSSKAFAKHLVQRTTISIKGKFAANWITPEIYANRHDIINVFGKFGEIEQIHVVASRKGVSFANIAFARNQARRKALAANNKIKVLDQIVSVRKRALWYHDKKSMENRTLHVTNIKAGTTKDELKLLFNRCSKKKGVKVKLSNTKIGGTVSAFVILTHQHEVCAAMDLHNYFLNGSNIKISYKNKQILTRQCYEDLTIVLKNKQHLSGVQIVKLENIFSTCGEIHYIDIIGKRRILAFITFKTKEAAAKALEMNGQTKQQLELELEPYSPIRDLRSIIIFNLDYNSTREDVQNHFAVIGEIEDIELQRGKAIIRFKDSETYCKSFLCTESCIRGRTIYIEPFTKNKNAIFESANKRTKKRARRNYF